MSGFVGQNSVMENGSPSGLSASSSSQLDSPNNAIACNPRPAGFNHARVRKESKYIENSRKDKIISRIWMPLQEYSNPKVTYNLLAYSIFNSSVAQQRLVVSKHTVLIILGAGVHMSWIRGA